MYRLTAARLIARRQVAVPSVPNFRRTISVTAPTLVKIRSSVPPPSSTRQNAPSPAERPPAPPPDTQTPPPPFEPLVSEASSGLPPHPIGETIDTPSEKAEIPLQAEIPLEQPSPSPVVEVEEPEPAISDFSKLPSMDIDPDLALPEPKNEGEEGGKKERTGASRKEYVTSMERQRRMYLRVLLGAALAGGIGGAYYLGKADESVAEVAEGGVGGHWSRLQTNVAEMFDIFSKPAFKVLLPDPLPPPHQRPYTLVIDLEGLLVSSSWDRATGWRTAKRPGTDYFLAYLSQFYEIVLFTSQPSINAAPVAEKLDPFGAFVPYKLFRESTRSHNGKVVKDLSYLNRDLSKVIMVDTVADHGALQPENSITIRPWVAGKGGDRGLVDLIPFLESIAMFNAKDVRPIIQAYAGKDIPIEYAKKEAEAKQKATEEWERQHPNSSIGGGSSWLSGTFGSVASSGKTRPNQPMTYLDIKRAEAQQTYLAEQKYWKDNEEEFKKLIEEDKAKQMAEMKGSLLGYFGGGAPKKEDGK